MAFDGQRAVLSYTARYGYRQGRHTTGMRGALWTRIQRATTVPVSGVLNLRLNFQ
jgi:hypothetical protein